MDVVSLGELLVDMFPGEVGRRLVEVSSFHPKPGGAPANVAVALARLGCESAFIGKVGDDAFGHHLAAVIARAGVNIEGMRYDPIARTTMAFIASPDEHQNEYLFYRNPGADTRLIIDELDTEMLANTKFLHFGSLSLVEDPIKSSTLQAIKLVKDAGGMISMDVNYRPSLWPSVHKAYLAVLDILPSVDLLKVNELELELLTAEEDPSHGSEKLIELGPTVCVITTGAGGSYFRTPGGFDFVPAFKVKTVDATGCGDSFIAGLLSRLLRDPKWRIGQSKEDFRRHLMYANAVGAITATKKGVIPALPNSETVQNFLDKKPEWRELNG